MLHKLREYIAKQALIHGQQRLLLAVSGGIDSMVLLHLLHKTGYELAVAHCNFKLRGKESDADEQFVKKICVRYRVPFFTKNFNTAQQAAKNKTGIQETARHLRYEWFAQLMKQHGFDKLVTAHQATDQLETVLLNLSRGTGLKGLEGIPVIHEYVVRPLLFATRKEIEIYARKNKIAYREDSSNASDKYARNRIRLNVLPQLLQINPQAVEHVMHTSEVVREANAFIAAETAKWIKKHSHPIAEGTAIEVKPVLKHKTPAFLLFQVLAPYGFNKEQVKQILEAAETQAGKIFRSATHQLLKDRSEFLVVPLTAAHKNEKIISLPSATGKISTPGFELKWKKKKRPAQLVTEKHAALVDAARLTFPLTLRPWKDGDRFQPLGMKGKKKLSDFLVDEKISRVQKQKVLVLESAGEIVWVVNHRLAEAFKVTPKTGDVIEFVYRPR